MTSVEKAQEALEKTRSKVKKLEQKVERITKKLESATDEWEKNWLTGDLGRAQADLKAAKNRLEKRYVTLNKAKDQEQKISEFPESVIKMIKHVQDMTFEDLINARDENKKLYYASRSGDADAKKKYNRLSEFERKIMWIPDEEILTYSKDAGKEFALDLVERTKEVVGDVTDWEHLRFGAQGLEGVVTGTEGKAAVFTIVAGGYNIQRRHYRVLVKRR